MLWQAIIHWAIAGCLSGAAIMVSATPPQGIAPSPDPLIPLSQTSESPEISEPVSGGHIDSPDSIARHPSGASSFEEPIPLNPIAGSPAIKEAGTGSDVPPALAGSQPDFEIKEYQVQPEDVLQITVYEEPDLTTKVRVAGSGEINFPLLGRIRVAGLSVIEVQEKLTQLLAEDYLVNPQVQVFVETYHERSVFVTGAVGKPGSYPLPMGKPTTLMEAVAMAGGFNEKAAVNSTRIVRIESGHEKTIYVKANDIVKKGDKNKDVEVYPNDVIFVPESFF